MAQKNQSEQSGLILTRVFDAPRERVFSAWTDPYIFMRWWGPKGFVCPVCKIDLKVGGKFLGCMRAPDGKDYWSTGVYKEIVPYEKIVVTDCFADEKGNVVPASYYGMNGDFSLEMLVTVTFEEKEGKTKMVLRHDGMPAGDNRNDATQGWNESFDKLEGVFKNKT